MAYVCRLGRAGVAVTQEKREGDLKTPSGQYPLRQCYYRPDRLAAPLTCLPIQALTPSHGWCDDPGDKQYNQAVLLPYPARHETLWRDDHVYDLIIPLGYNDGIDSPVIAGAGSAIFMHVMRPDGVGTEGCIALEQEALLYILSRITPDSRVVIPTELAGDSSTLLGHQ